MKCAQGHFYGIKPKEKESRSRPLPWSAFFLANQTSKTSIFSPDHLSKHKGLHILELDAFCNERHLEDTIQHSMKRSWKFFGLRSTNTTCLSNTEVWWQNANLRSQRKTLRRISVTEFACFPIRLIFCPEILSVFISSPQSYSFFFFFSLWWLVHLTSTLNCRVIHQNLVNPVTLARHLSTSFHFQPDWCLLWGFHRPMRPVHPRSRAYSNTARTNHTQNFSETPKWASWLIVYDYFGRDCLSYLTIVSPTV